MLGLTGDILQPPQEPKPQIVDLTREQNSFGLNSEILVPKDQLGTNKWPEMIKKTQETGNEYGIVISYDGKKLLTSNILEGSKDSFIPPFMPHGIKSLLLKAKDIALIHSHNIPPAIEHLPTTTLSNGDITTHINNTYNATVMIDRGGLHILLGRNPFLNPDQINCAEIVSNAIKKAKANSGLVAEVRKEIGEELSHVGIGYYYSPDLEPSADGFVHLTDVRKTKLQEPKILETATA